MSQAALDALECYAFSGEEGAGGEDTPPGTNHVVKQCAGCKACKPPAEFNNDNSKSDGKQSKCRECQKEYKGVWNVKRKRKDAQDEDDKEEEFETSEPASEPGPGDLYVMQNSRIPGELKIGRSQDVEARRRSLQRSQNYRMLVLAVFPQAGNIEGCVHEMLSYCRVTEEAAGREWFRCSLQTAFAAIGQTLGESRFAATSAGSSA
jgi:hypothetical protein